MGQLIAGLALWSLSHWFRRLAPGLRAALGTAGKGVVAVLSLLGIWLMVRGYGAADPAVLWDFGAAGRHLNNLMMLAAVALVGASHSKSRLRAAIRHPMLWGAVIWALAHLIVNGDVRSLVLFGGLGLWALISIMLINRAEPGWTPPEGLSAKGDLRLGVIALVAYAAIGALHGWLGPNPFGG